MTEKYNKDYNFTKVHPPGQETKSEKQLNIPGLLHRSVIKIVLLYAVTAAVYILSSDALLHLLSSDPLVLTRFQSYKGIIFIIVTGTFLYFLIRKHFATISGQLNEIYEIEEELKLSKELFSKAFNRSPEILSISSLSEGRFVKVNDGFVEVTGYSKSELIGKTSVELNLWRYPEHRDLLINQLKAEGKVKDFESVLLNKNAEERLFKLSAEIINVRGEGHLLLMCRDITENRRVEAALKESEINYRTLIESMHDGVFVLNQFKVIFVNPAFEQITGYAKEELLNKDIAELLHNDEKGLISHLDENNKEYEDKINDELHRFIKKNGEKIYTSLSVRTILYNNQPAILGTIQDISEKIKAEKAVSQSESRFKNFADLLPQTVFEIDTEGKLTFVNRASFSAFGYVKDDFEKGLNVIDMIAPEDRNRVLKDMFLIFKGHEIGSNEYSALRKDGSKFPVVVFTSPISNGNKFEGLRGILIDISDLKKHEHELRKLSNAVEQSPVSIIITDASGNIEYVNPKFEQVTGYTASEVLGKNPSVVKSGIQSKEFYEQLWMTISSGEEWRGEFNNKKKDGTIFWESASISPIKNDKGVITHYIAVKEDITSQKIVNEELIKALNKAEESERLKSEFLAQISHEIRTPLNTILGFSTLLAGESVRTDSERGQISKSLNQAGKRLLRTIDLILNMSMLKAGKMDLQPVKIDAFDVIKCEAEKHKVIAAEKNLKLNIDYAAFDSYVVCDIYILREIISNLIDNAIKFTHKGEITIKITDNENNFYVTVSDTGIGISEEYIERIFEPFSQEQTGYSRSFDGNGLGLSLVKKYLDLINGSITVESKKGKGSVFTIKLSKK